MIVYKRRLYARLVKTFLLINTAVFFTFSSFSQKKDSLHISVNADAYASWFTQASNAKRPAYWVNYTGLNTAGLNLLAGSVHYRTNHFRTTLSAMAGEYARQNLVAEDPLARHIYEANVGYRFTSDEDIWLDVGVLPSHIGMESVAGIKNYAGTRNIISDITPYYETGFRLSYTPNDEWFFAILALNGWQRITAPFSAFGKNWGIQVTYRPNPHWIINSSSYIGEMPEYQYSERTRIYSNLFSTINLNPRMSVSAGWDWGIQGNRSMQWNDLLFQYRYEILHKKLSFTTRYEYLTDPGGLFLFKDASFKPKHHLTSVNFDYKSTENIMLRTELNYLFANRSVLNSGPDLSDRQLSFFFIVSIQLNYKK